MESVLLYSAKRMVSMVISEVVASLEDSDDEERRQNVRNSTQRAQQHRQHQGDKLEIVKFKNEADHHIRTETPDPTVTNTLLNLFNHTFQTGLDDSKPNETARNLRENRIDSVFSSILNSFCEKTSVKSTFKEEAKEADEEANIGRRNDDSLTTPGKSLSYHIPFAQEEPFQWPPLIVPGSVRLIRFYEAGPLSLTMEVFVLNSSTQPPYSTLSYTCEEPVVLQQESVTADGRSRYPTHINGQLWRVESTLFHALSRLRDSRHQSSYFWIDTLCIRQDDSRELGQQISRNNGIYAGAEEVVVWLGEDDKASMTALQLMQGASTTCSRTVPEVCHTFCTSQHDKSSEATQSFRRLPRFSINDHLALHDFVTRCHTNRSWYVQDAKLLKSGTVMCGSMEMAWKAVVDISSLMLRSAIDPVPVARVIET